MIVEIEKMSYGPDAVGHLDDGKVVFVPHGAVGDVLDIEIVEDKPRMARGRIIEVVEPGSARIAPFAPELLDSLCPWQQLDYACALEQKRAIVCDALRRVARFDAQRAESLVAATVACEQPWGYRNKLELACERDGRGRLELGFHRLGSDRIQPVSSCAVANRAIAGVPRKLAGALRFALGNEAAGLFRVGVRGSTITNSLEVALWTEPSSIQRPFVAKAVKDATGASSVVRIIADAGSARRVRKLEVLGGAGVWKERLAGCGFKVSAPSFFQVNTAQAERMVDLVLAGLGEVDGMFVADLYCGVGTFSVPLAKRGADVACIEFAGSSVANLRENLAAADAEAEVVCDDVERVLPEFDGLDAIVVDPPRAGLSKGVVEQIVAVRPGRLVYVSCDPQTLARDIARLEEGGARLLRCTPVDMFPQTHHIECVSELAF